MTALLILRTAPLRSRLYVWTLVTLATGTSIWANALHAIRLNEQARLHLNNATVGALSAIAPLALAGAVHLYLVINRHLTANKPAATEPPTATAPSSEPPTSTANRATTATLAATPESATTAKHASKPPTPPAAATQAVPATPITPATPAKAPLPATASSEKAAPSSGGRKPRATETYLLELAHQIHSETGHVSRTPVENAARAQGYTVDRTRAKKAADAVLEEAAVTKDLASTA
ncbi:cytoskeletal protein RodZ [Streptomyces filamentosus]